MTYVLLFHVLPSRDPGPRQPIRRLSRRHLLLGPYCYAAVYGGHLLPAGELRGSYFVPGIRFAQTLEWYYPPGFVAVNTGHYVRCQHLSLSCFGPSPSVRVRGLVQLHGGSTVPLLSLLMVCLLTGSFSVELLIPRISPILASFGLSGRGLWAMHFPVHLRGWELSLAARAQHRIPSCSSQFQLFGDMLSFWLDLPA